MTDQDTSTAADPSADEQAVASLRLSQHVAAGPETGFEFLVDSEKSYRG